MLHYDHSARLQLSREKAAELAKEYQRAQKLESRSGRAFEQRAPGLVLRLRRRKAQQTSARA